MEITTQRRHGRGLGDSENIGEGKPRLQGLGADAQSLSTRVGYNEPEAGDGVAVSGRVQSYWLRWACHLSQGLGKARLLHLALLSLLIQQRCSS